MTVRAVRNNNPGNIRIGAKWQGLMPLDQMTPEQVAEGEFCVFVSSAMGFRAMCQTLHTYHYAHGINTLREAITRWAPPSENNTEAYIKSVCDYTGIGPDQPFPFSDEQHMAALLKAISIRECGGWLFKMSDLYAGIEATTEPTQDTIAKLTGSMGRA